MPRSDLRQYERVVTADERPVLHAWLNHVMPLSAPRFRQQVGEFGMPILGLTGPEAEEGELGGTLGGSPNCGVVLRYLRGGTRIEVTTGRYALGGTQNLLRRTLEMATTTREEAVLPFSVSVTERLLMLPVVDQSAQFRVVEATSGHWIAVGGWKKRHLRLEGSPGTSPDGLGLTEVVLP